MFYEYYRTIVQVQSNITSGSLNDLNFMRDFFDMMEHYMKISSFTVPHFFGLSNPYTILIYNLDYPNGELENFKKIPINILKYYEFLENYTEFLQEL